MNNNEPQLIPVDYDPFAQGSKDNPQLVPVDHDPFADSTNTEDINHSAPGFKVFELPWYEEYLLNPLRQGYAQGKQGISTALADLGITGKDRAAYGARQADLYRQSERFGSSLEDEEALQRVSEAESFGEALAEVIENPKIISDTALRSMGIFAPTLAATTAASTLGGPVATATVAGTGSAATEYALTLTSTMREHGLDPSNPRDWASALDDDELMSQARESGVKRGIAVGTFDAATAGLAGTLLRSAKPGIVSSVTRSAGELGIQAAGGMGGETTAQLLDKGEISSPGEILLEGIAEAPTAVAEVPGNIRHANRKAAKEPEVVSDGGSPQEETPSIPEADPHGFSDLEPKTGLIYIGLPDPDAGLSKTESGYQATSPIKEAGISRVKDKPVPESTETIEAQLKAFEEGRKPAVLLTPGESLPALPEGAQVATIPERGVLVYKDPAVLKLAQNDRMGEALGYGISEKPVSDTVVTARDKEGTVVQDVLTDGRPEVVEAAEKVAGPGGTVEARPATEVLEERQEKTEQSKSDATNEKGESERLVEKLESGAKKSKSFDAYKSWANGFFGRDKARALLNTGQLENAWKAVYPDKQVSKEQVDEAASEAATSPKNDLPEPTEAQKEAGNYKVGKVVLHGLDISIENPKDSTRSGKDSDGKEWKTKMAHHYGYIKGKGEAADGDHPDVFLGPDAENADLPVFVVDQIDPKTGNFDEHKVLIGFKNQLAAKRGYLKNYEKGWKGAGAVNKMSLDEFKAWLESGKTKQSVSYKAPKRLKPKSKQDGIVENRPANEALDERRRENSKPVTTTFKVKPISENQFIVLGDKDQIHTTLNQAGVTLKGLFNKRRGGLVFPMKHQETIQAALTPIVDELTNIDSIVEQHTKAIKTSSPHPEKTKEVDTELPPSGANAFAPGDAYVGFIKDMVETSPKTQAKPIRREDVLIPFLKALDVPLYQGRVKGKGRLGFYLPKKESVRIRNKNDLETASHELAHLIDDRVPEIRKAWLKDKVLREELRSISYDQKKVYEGFAEGVRLWMTQPEKLAQVAPHFNEWFNQFAEQHEYGSALKKAQQGMTDWFAQDALTRAKSKIGNAKPINESLHNTFNNFRQTVSDDLDGLYKMERGLTSQIKPSGPYETARLTRGAFSMVEGALTIGAPMVNPDGSFVFKGKSLEAILEPVSDRIEEWTRYAVGRSAKELLLQNREYLFTKAEITAMLKLETPEFKQVFRDYQTWNKRVVDFAQTLGIINPETRKLWRRAQYLPFYRVNADHRSRAENNVSGDWQGIQRLTGGTDNIRDVLQNMIQNASQLIVQAVRNEARASVADMADTIKGGGRFMVKIPRGTGQTQISKAEIMRVVEQAGIVPEDVLADYSRLKDLVTVFQFGQAPKGKNVVAVMRGGKADYYEVGDPLLMRSLQALDRPVKNWITRFLGGFKRVGQSSITLSLDFISANLARDTVMGGIMSKHGFRPFLDSIRGMKSRITKDPAYKEFIANGGGFSSVYLDDQAFKKRLEQFYSKKGINYRTVIDTPAKFLYFLETLADAFEMSTRLGEFKRARGKGSDPRHAAYSAREVSTDFAMRGDSEVLGFFFDTVMFLKAGVNGMDRLYRGVADDTNRRQIAVKTALLALASTALYALNRDNDLYDKLEDWDKDGHWHFFIPKAGEKVNAPLEERYHHFRYPKLWEIGAVSSMAERSLENLLESTPKKLGKDYLRIVLDQFKLDYVPQAIEPLYEQYLNRNRFTGAPIETQTMEQLAPFARSKHYTAKILQETGLKSRNLPRALQVPPARTEALLRGYLNTWAMYGLSLADAALYDDKPDMRVDDYPVLRRFYAAEPAKRTQYETQFYDMLREATELRRTIRQMDKIGRPDIADEISNRKRVDNYNALTSINEVFQAINRDIRKVYIDDRLTSQQKREKLDNLTRQKNTLLEAAVKEIESQESDQSR
ncbi:MAG: hypothetical protein KUF79_17450 [Candidatus Thiodiazotropha sp. (ex Ctena orbiculata)]|nr:hypothetical protein [Candidatus Thiodiazotropha taylori]